MVSDDGAAPAVDVASASMGGVTDAGARKTRPTSEDVAVYVAGVEHAHRREDTEAALALVRDVTDAEPVMWGPSMIGFGTQRYTTADGKEHEWFAVGLAPRKAALTLYGLTYYGSNDDLLERLGPHTTGKGCLYVKRMADIDHGVLRELVERAWHANSTGSDQQDA